MSGKRLTLEEMLMHLKDLIDRGLERSDDFKQSLREYLCSAGEINDENQIKKAIQFLRDNKKIGRLSTSYMITFLESKLEEITNLEFA